MSASAVAVAPAEMTFTLDQQSSEEMARISEESGLDPKELIGIALRILVTTFEAIPLNRRVLVTTNTGYPISEIILPLPNKIRPD